MPLDLPYEIINDDPASATPVQADFARIEQHINAEVIDRAGTVAMTGQLRLVGNPVNSLDAAPKQYVDTLIPVGGVMLFGGIAAPPGGSWLVCDGSPYESAAYPELFAIIGTRFGGSGGFFNTPNLADRVPLGASATRPVGTAGGSNDLVVVPHTHPIDHNHGTPRSGYMTQNVVHGHSINNHNHGAGGLRMNNHSHGPGGGDAFIYRSPGPTGGFMGTVEGPPGVYIDFQGSTGGASDLGINGATDVAAIGANGSDINHQHDVTVPAHAGQSGAVVGATTGPAANANLPQFVVMAYLIRAA